MGEWSDYFDDFPEENPANWVNGRFDPQLRAQINREEAQRAVANLEVRQLITNAKRERKAKALFETGDCPQCGQVQLNSYQISEAFYLCECQECGIYGAGATQRTTKHLPRPLIPLEKGWIGTMVRCTEFVTKVNSLNGSIHRHTSSALGRVLPSSIAMRSGAPTRCGIQRYEERHTGYGGGKVVLGA